MTMKLCLVAINPTKLRDKESGEEVVKYKYVFLTETNKPVVGWSDDKILEDRLHSSNSYQDSSAHAYEVSTDVWQDKLTYRVRLPH